MLLRLAMVGKLHHLKPPNQGLQERLLCCIRTLYCSHSYWRQMRCSKRPPRRAWQESWYTGRHCKARSRDLRQTHRSRCLQCYTGRLASGSSMWSAKRSKRWLWERYLQFTPRAGCISGRGPRWTERLHQRSKWRCRIRRWPRTYFKHYIQLLHMTAVAFRSESKSWNCSQAYHLGCKECHILYRLPS